MPAQFSAADYTAALQRFLPRGRAWPSDPDTVQVQVLGGFAGSFERLDEAAMQLLADFFPATARAGLVEWEETLGLPDPCAGPDPTIALRQAHVLARFAGKGGQSVPFFIQFALNLGIAITITEFTGSLALANQWQVNAPGELLTFFEAGSAVAGDPIDNLASVASVLQCEIERLKPAHTTVIFNYSLPVTGDPFLEEDGSIMFEETGDPLLEES